MPLTRDFKKTIQARIKSDPAFRNELLREGVECLLAGELETGKAILRDYVNATIGFEKLSGLTHKSPKSLMRMLSSKGNPQARNLLELIAHLQKTSGLRMQLSLYHIGHERLGRINCKRPSRATTGPSSAA